MARTSIVPPAGIVVRPNGPRRAEPSPPAGRRFPFRAPGSAFRIPHSAFGISSRLLWWDTLCFGVLLLLVLLTFREAIFQKQVVFEQDTLNFYYPLESWVSQQLKHGHFPLWNPNIFAGYPIFADGELGLASPLHLLLLTLLPVQEAYVWQSVSAALIGAASMFFFCRALGLRGLAALLGGLVFGLGSFLAEQRHHDDMVRTVAWAPLVLACTEIAFHRTGWRAIRWLIGAALALAMTAFGLHPQGLAITALLLATYMLFRALTPPPYPLPYEGRGRDEILGGFAPQGPRTDGKSLSSLAGEGWEEGASALRAPRSALLRRVPLTLLAGLFIAALGLGLAAVQLLPTAQAGLATYRESQPQYAFATSYELHPQNLISLVFPYFFRAIDSRPWTLWAPWEVTVYVGIVPLVLGLVGLFRGPRPLAFYFGGIALVGLWLALADSVPLDLYAWLWRLPGLSALRVPGRYAFLFVFGWSVLAAYGLAALSKSITPSPLAEKPAGRANTPSPLAGEGWGEGASARRWRLLSRRQVAAGRIAVLGLAAVSALALGMNELHSTLLGQETATESWIEATYLSLPHGEGLTPDIVYLGLVHSLDPTTPRTATSLALLGITVLLSAGVALGKARLLWSLALVAAAAADLISFGTGLHYRVSLHQLDSPSPAAQFLQAHAGPWRVFSVIPPLTPSVQPDRLVPLGVLNFDGYSSLESRRNFSYSGQLTGTQDQLLDLANIRYVVYPARLPAEPDFQRVPFDPERPLMIGAAGAPGGSESYAFADKRADSMWVVAALTHAVEVPQDAVVAELTLVPTSGDPVVVPVRAGVDVAEWAYDRPDIVGQVQHAKPGAIAFDRPESDPFNGPFNLHLYYSKHDLPRPLEVKRVDVRYVYPVGDMELYGLGLQDDQTGVVAGTVQTMRADFRSVYRDSGIEIFENTAALPRAYVVPGAVLQLSNHLGIGPLLYTPFDPSREVLLEASQGEPWVRPAPPDVGLIEAHPVDPTPCGGWGIACGSIADYQASAPAGGLFVYTVTFADGWRSWVDGQEQPVLRANYLFQAVPLTPGDHTVELRYEPPAVRLGLMITLVSALVALLLLGVASLRTR